MVLVQYVLAFGCVLPLTVLDKLIKGSCSNCKCKYISAYVLLVLQLLAH